MNAAHIKSVLHRRYGTGNATAIGFEVAHGTGRHANRHMDAVVMDLWPSRGLTLHAMEIKCSMSDLKREIAQGSKAEEIAQHCDYFSIVTPHGLLKTEKSVQLPKAWGLIEIKNNDDVVFTKEAVKTKARSIDREFMAALLRAVGNASPNSFKRLEDEMHKRVYAGFNTAVDESAKKYNKQGALWAELESQLTAAGIKYAWDQDILKALVFVLSTNMLKKDGGLRKMQEDLIKMGNIFDQHLRMLEVPK